MGNIYSGYTTVVGGRFCKTAVFSALMSGYRHIIHQKNACNLLHLYISTLFNIISLGFFLEILILFDFIHFYFLAYDILLIFF